MKFKQIFVPDQENHVVDLPKEFYGKKVEVSVVELSNDTDQAQPLPPIGKKIKVEELFEAFGGAPDYPPSEDIRSKAWNN